MRHNGDMNQVELADLARTLLDKQRQLGEVTQELIFLSSNVADYDAKHRAFLERRNCLKADVGRLEEELEKAIEELGYRR